MRLTTIEKKVLAGFAATLLIVGIMAVGSVFSIRAFLSASRWVAHTYDVLQAIASAQTQVQASELSTRAYFITGNETRLEQRNSAHDRVNQVLDSLAEQTRDNRIEQVRVALLRDEINRLRLIQQRMIDSRGISQSDYTAARSDMAGSYQQLQKITVLLASMQETEKQFLDQRIEWAHATALYTIGIFGALVLSMFGIKLYLFMRIKEEVQERERIDADLIETKQGLEVTNKELESFSYSISHDLRSPLRAVNGFARILDSEYGQRFDEEGRRIIGVILRNSEKMNALIDDLLAFSRVGRGVINKTDVDMTTLVGKVHSDLLTASEYGSVDFSVGELPDAAGDPALLTQVWTNLVSNAFKYSNKNPTPQVAVSGEVCDKEYVYSVRDNGVGFDMRYYDKLFGVFQRLHSDSEFHGTGVGLAIAQRIVSRHGGRIWAESAPGQGATFHFSLPRG
ncbi:MAG: sensor histidine kinase [Gammaproteobacteria bacterium]